MSIAYLNGSFIPLEDARISPLDRGFLFADGVYEVIPYYEGKSFGLEGHLKRLERSLNEIKLPVNFSIEDWMRLIDTLVSKNEGGDVSVYLQVTRGAYAKRDHALPEKTHPTIFLMVSPIAFPLTADAAKAEGIAVITLPDIRWDRCDIKSIALLPNILLKQQAAEEGAQEAILVRDNLITECATANVFAVKNGTIYTPSKNEHILGGVTRDVIIALASEYGVPLEEISMDVPFIEQADEIWISSSTREIVPVITLNGHAVGSLQPGSVWKQMANYYQANKKHIFT